MAVVSKNMYIGDLDEIVDKSNNIYHKIKKWYLLTLIGVHIFTCMLVIMIKILNSKLLIMREYQNTET